MPKITIEIASDDATTDDMLNFVEHLQNEFDLDGVATGYPAWAVRIVEDTEKNT